MQVMSEGARNLDVKRPLALPKHDFDLTQRRPDAHANRKRISPALYENGWLARTTVVLRTVLPPPSHPRSGSGMLARPCWRAK